MSVTLSKYWCYHAREAFGSQQLWTRSWHLWRDNCIVHLLYIYSP